MPAKTAGDDPAADDLPVHAEAPDQAVQAAAMKFTGGMPDTF